MLKTIKNKDFEITISLKGAELVSAKYKNHEYIWQANEKYWNRSSPILFPIVGSLKDHKTIINGITYNIPQHGFLKDQEFIIRKLIASADSKGKFIALYLQNKFNQNTFKMYPFEYEVKIIYKLYEDQLVTSIKVKNLGMNLMPFNLGLHPGFNLLNEKEDFNYSLEFSKTENIASPKVMPNATLNFNETVLEMPNVKKLELKKSLFDIDTIILPKVKSNKLVLTSQNNRGVIFEYKKFTTLSIWTPTNDAPFICLEPWIGYNDRFDTDSEFLKKDCLVKLGPNKIFSCSYSFKFI